MNSLVGYCLPILAGLLTLNSASAATFQGVGQLPNGIASYSDTISGNGSTVVGHAVIGPTAPTGSTTNKAYSWTSSEGIQTIGSLPNRAQSYSHGVSFDGSVVVGISTGNLEARAFRWTAASGMVDLGTLGGFSSGAYSTNRDGSVVVGSSGTSGGNGNRAYRWTASEGMVNLGVVPSGTDSVAWDVSDDGNVVVGQSTAGQLRAFRWELGTGMVNLGTLSGGETGASQALAISGDGSVIVGSSASALGDQGFRWTSSSGMVGLGLLSGTSSSLALGADLDGSTIVGQSGERAFLWDVSFGMQDLQSLLSTEYGLSTALSGWQLTSATGISDDGFTISGYGNHNGVYEAWIATIPEPSSAVLCVSVLASAFLFRSRQRSRSESLR